jgi:predicted NACHT family NTPase
MQYVELWLTSKWEVDDKPFYDKTGGFTAAWKMVQSEIYMTIIGGPGSGKSATARHIALQYEEKGWEVVPVFRLEEIILPSFLFQSADYLYSVNL